MQTRSLRSNSLTNSPKVLARWCRDVMESLTEVQSSNPARVTIKIRLVRKAMGNYHINIIYHP